MGGLFSLAILYLKMTFGLANSSKRARTYAAITNRNSGGGNKKTGFPYQIGRRYSTSIAFAATDPAHGHCCKLSDMSRIIYPLANPSRNLGRMVNKDYYHVPGSGH